MSRDVWRQKSIPRNCQKKVFFNSFSTFAKSSVNLRLQQHFHLLLYRDFCFAVSVLTVRLHQCCCDAYRLYAHIHVSPSEPSFCVRVLPAILAAFKNIEKPDLLKLWTLANVHKHDSTYLSYFTHPKCSRSLLTGFQNGWAKMSPSTPPQSESCLHSPVQYINSDRRVINFPYLLLARFYDA